MILDMQVYLRASDKKWDLMVEIREGFSEFINLKRYKK